MLYLAAAMLYLASMLETTLVMTSPLLLHLWRLTTTSWRHPSIAHSSRHTSFSRPSSSSLVRSVTSSLCAYCGIVPFSVTLWSSICTRSVRPTSLTYYSAVASTGSCTCSGIFILYPTNTACRIVLSRPWMNDRINEWMISEFHCRSSKETSNYNDNV